MRAILHRPFDSRRFLTLAQGQSRGVEGCTIRMMTLVRRALGLIDSRWKEPSSCEACGSSFTCGASLTGCWCWKVKLTDEDRARLRSSYSKCLCPACLELASHRGTEL